MSHWRRFRYTPWGGEPKPWDYVFVASGDHVEDVMGSALYDATGGFTCQGFEHERIDLPPIEHFENDLLIATSSVRSARAWERKAQTALNKARKHYGL